MRNQLLTVLRAMLRVNLAEELQYRGNFLASLLGTVFRLVTALLTLAVFFRHTTWLGGWNFWEVLVLLGVFNTLAGITEAVLRPGIGQLPQEVRSGTFDLALARPMDAQLYLSFRRIDLWRLTDPALGLALVAFALHRLDQLPTLIEAGAFLVMLGSAAIVVYAIWLSLMSLAFWFVAVEYVGALFDSVYEAARYPTSTYKGTLRFLFVYLIPVTWTTTMPAATLTGRLSPWAALPAVAAAMLALLLSRWFWRVALRHYTSAGG